jgi:hypothetical protein
VVTFAFQRLPGDAADIPRPGVPVTIQGFESLVNTCLIDSGSLHNRFGGWLADRLGIDLAGVEPDPVGIGGARMLARTVRLGLAIDELAWEAPVSFCDPWPFGFHLLGQEGFLRYFDVRLRAAQYVVEVQPEGG